MQPIRPAATSVSLWAFVLVSAVARPVPADEPPPAVAPFAAAAAKAHQEAWAKHLQQPVQITNSLGMKFRLIPPGSFTMGSPADEEWHREEEVLHRVTLTKPYYLAVTEVTPENLTYPGIFRFFREFLRCGRRLIDVGSFVSFSAS